MARGDRDNDHNNLAIRTYGHRIFQGQTVPEYLLEFALVFLGNKGEPNGDDTGLGGPGKFPTRRVNRGELRYRAEAHIGLKRFIFFERSKQENRLEIDRYAYEEMRKLIEQKIKCEHDDLTSTEVVDIIQELFYGYNAVLLNRSWFAQSLLPVCPELIFPEAIRRDARYWSSRRYNFSETGIRGNPDVDNAFDFNRYLFLARGGEVYYLHVLSGLLAETPEAATLREQIETGLNELFHSRKELSRLAGWIQQTWETYMQVENRLVEKACEWIPKEYEMRSIYTCRELACFLGAKIDALQKIELLSAGVVLQILRMMHDRAGALLRPKAVRPPWVVHVPKCASDHVRSLAMRSYRQCEDDLFGALYTQKADHETPEQLREMVAEAAGNAHLLFGKLGRAVGLVVPPKGKSMRFSLSEDLLKFLVLALVKPGEMLLLSEFLGALYTHFGFIIGPTELRAYQEGATAVGDPLTRYDSALLRENEEALKEMLKACGFLRDLSDATAIVENPFGGAGR